MNRIKELRKERGITQQELADALGISKRTVRNFESGHGYLNRARAQRMWETISDYFDESSSYVMGWSDTRRRDLGKRRVFNTNTNMGALRAEYDMGMDEFGKLLGVTRGSIFSYEHGLSRVHVDNAIEYAKILDVNAAFILDLTDNRDPHLLD